MFKTNISKNCAFNLRICIFLMVLLRYSSGVTSETETTQIYDDFNNTKEFKLSPDWSLAPLGRIAAEFLGIAFIHSTTGPIRSTVQAGINDYKKIMHSLVGYTFIQQIPMTIIVALGLLGVFLLFLMPCFIVLYRNKQISTLQETEAETVEISPRKGWIALEVLLVFLAIVIFGGIIMCLAVTEFEEKFPEVFDFAIFTVEESYKLKSSIQNNYYHNLVDVSRAAFESIKKLYDVNDYLSIKFMERIAYRIKPVEYLARSIRWDVTDEENTLKTDRARLQSLQDTNDNQTERFMKEYLATLNALKEIFDLENAREIFGNLLDPVLQVPTYNATNLRKGVYNKSIESLEKVSKLNFAEKVHNMTHYLRKSVEFLYDPSELAEKLRKISYNTEEEIRALVRKYVEFIDRTYKEENRVKAKNDIRRIRQEMLEGFHYAYDLLFIFGIMSASLGAFFCFAHCLGLMGTGCLAKSSTSVYKTNLSHSTGKVILIFIYFTAIFLAFFWALSIFVFIVSTAPFEICLSLKDKSLIEVMVDRASVRRSSHLFSMFSSEHSGTNLTGSLINCANDSSFFSLLPDPIANMSSFEKIKNELDTYSVNDVIQDVIKNIPSMNISESQSSILNLEGVLDIEIPYFGYILQFLRELRGTNASVILYKIKNSFRSSDRLSSAADTAMKSYDALVGTLSTTAVEEVTYKNSLESVNVTVQTLKRQINGIKLTTKTLVAFLRQNSTDIYLSLLNDTVLDMIDGIYYNLDMSTREFRRTLSCCPVLNLLYKKIVYITCERLLYPVSAGWLGSFLVAIFFLLSLFLCIYVVPLFLKTPKLHTEDVPPPVVLPEDIPSASSTNILDKARSTSRETQPPEDNQNTEDRMTPATTSKTSSEDNTDTSKSTTNPTDKPQPTAQKTTKAESSASTSKSAEESKSNNKTTEVTEKKSSIKQQLS